MNVHPQTAAYMAIIVCIWDDIRSTALYNAAQDGYQSEIQLLLSDTLAENFNNHFSVPIFIGSKCGTYPISQPTVFIASDAAVAFWFFFAAEKGLAPAAISGLKHHRWLVDNTNHRIIQNKCPKPALQQVRNLRETSKLISVVVMQKYYYF
jgi:hypothetical protein